MAPSKGLVFLEAALKPQYISMLCGNAWERAEARSHYNKSVN